MLEHFRPFEEKLRADGAPRILIENFRRQYQRLREGQTGLIPLASIEPVPDLPSLDTLARHESGGREALARTVLIKLNGGLGTGMGLEKAKSLIQVKRGLTFLDIVLQQARRIRETCHVALPLVLMNSFSTERDTLLFLAGRTAPDESPELFRQNRVPKIRADSFEPVSWPQDPEKEWCPPGHGDLYTALPATGLMKKLLDRGFEYAFVSNSDNLGATLDHRILGYFASRKAPFMLEFTMRTEADKKGGHLAKARNGGLVLRELAQCPPEETGDFQDIAKHRYFNTNNLWLNLREVGRHLDATGGMIELPVIMNRKTVDPRDPASPAVIQLETAMGTAISVFPGSEALCVPRTRFAPVKSTDDLLALWSDAYVMTENMHVALHPSRKNGPPVVTLDPKHYRVLDDFFARFPAGAPSMVQCDSLTVEGDVLFGKDVTLRGKVHVRNRDRKQIVIEDGSVLET